MREFVQEEGNFIQFDFKVDGAPCRKGVSVCTNGLKFFIDGTKMMHVDLQFQWVTVKYKLEPVSLCLGCSWIFCVLFLCSLRRTNDTLYWNPIFSLNATKSFGIICTCYNRYTIGLSLGLYFQMWSIHVVVQQWSKGWILVLQKNFNLLVLSTISELQC